MANIGVYRAVGSPALDTARYQHSACTHTEIVAKGTSSHFAAIAVVPTRVPIGFCKQITTDALEGMNAQPSSAAF
jgi:hypothetical protein